MYRFRIKVSKKKTSSKKKTMEIKNAEPENFEEIL